MERKIERVLEDWHKRKNRLPLIIQGARQVGKTYSVLSFGRKNYYSLAYLNFESNIELHKVFEQDLSPGRILSELSVITGETIAGEKSLIFFDEIQACSRALTSLKYFAEEAPEYHIIAAGSLLGVTLNLNDSSFPVGKVEMINMYPLDFEEYLWAIGQQPASDIIRNSFLSLSQCSIHDTLIGYFRTYLFTGGMPYALSRYIETRDHLITSIVKSNINNSQIADMAKHAGKSETVRIIAAYKSIPLQLAKENHKFQYKVIKSGARVAEYGSAIEWLKASGIILACHRISEGRIPLMAYYDPAAFKLYHSDTGLLIEMTGLTEKSLTSEGYIGPGFRGALAENYVATALVSRGYTPYYWESGGKAEVDFVIQTGGVAIPVEVKSSDNVRSKSLNEFIRRYSPPYAYRVSTKNFGKENNIRSIPLYALFCI